MRWLLFLSRLAFICGFAFVLSLVALFYKEVQNQELLSTVIIIGYIIGLVVVPISLIAYMMLAIAGKKPGSVVPKWLFIANLLFFIVLLTYIFYLNDPYYFKR
jgi:hypothetical protein